MAMIQMRVIFVMYIMTCMQKCYCDTVLPRLSETSVIIYPNAAPNVWSLFKKNGILTKIADSATEQSTCVCVSYVHVQCRHTVVRHRVQCEVKRPSDATFVHIFML